MYRFIQRHGKKVMAVMMAGLMIAFIIPSTAQYGGGQNPVIGRVGDEKIRGQELLAAQQDWQILHNLTDGRGGRLSGVLGPQVEAEISQHPILFLLLQKEAEQLGVTISQDNLQSILTNTPGLITTDAERNQLIARAVGRLMLVAQGAQRAGSAVKVTEPMVEHQLAQVGQSITLDLVDFTTAKYIEQAKGVEPTAEQLKAHFEKYADTLPGSPTESNPFGFGYKYPNRVKLQYIMVPHSEVRKVIEGMRTPYEWEVEARKHYRQNQALYQTEPTTQASSSFDLNAPSTRPTTKPYEAVQEQIKETLTREEAEKRMAAIRDRLSSTMGGDWVAYRNALGPAATTQTTTAPTTAGAPASTLGVPYASFEYLQKLAQQVQANANFGVLPTAVSLADKWLTLEELNKLPGLGQAHLNGVPAGSYLMSMALPFVPEQQLAQGGWLRIMEPTRPMVDSNDSIYIARLSAADPSHKPASIAEVEQQIRTDLLTARAYELAKADASKLLEQARLHGLKEAAGDKAVISVGPVTLRSGQVVPQLALAGPPADRFVGRAFSLLNSPAATSPAAATTTTQRADVAKPVDLIELPLDGRVLVGQLGEVQALWNDRSRPMEQAQIHSALGRTLQQRFNESWFNRDSIMARMRFVPEAGAAAALEPDAPAPPPRPPIL